MHAPMRTRVVEGWSWYMYVIMMYACMYVCVHACMHGHGESMSCIIESLSVPVCMKIVDCDFWIQTFRYFQSAVDKVKDRSAFIHSFIESVRSEWGRKDSTSSSSSAAAAALRALILICSSGGWAWFSPRRAHHHLMAREGKSTAGHTAKLHVSSTSDSFWKREITRAPLPSSNSSAWWDASTALRVFCVESFCSHLMCLGFVSWSSWLGNGVRTLVVVINGVRTQVEGCDKRTLEWLAYAHFHHGEHDKALVLYKELLSVLDADPNYHTYSSACLFYLANYDEAKQAALRGKRTESGNVSSVQCCLAVPHAWLLSNRDSQYAILSILIVWVFIKKKNLRLKDCRLQLKRNYTYVCISEGPRTLHIPSAKLLIADDQVPRVHCRSAYCFT